MSTKVFRWSTASRTCAGPALALTLAFALVTPPGPARAATSAPGPTLTCFAIDVSGSNLVASGGEPASANPASPSYVRIQAVSDQRMLAQIAAWHATAVVAVTLSHSRLANYLTNLLGPPTVVAGDVMAWRT